MAGHEWDDWFEREELIGQISDIRVQNLQVEREVVQKRTFTRWMNLHLEKCNPRMEVRDLFRDIQDGKILMALLEELSGCKLLHGFKPSAHRIFRLNNIAKVLTFLEERNVKLVSIDATDIADGNSSIVLGLIWNIILFFQIKELTGNIKNQFPSSSSLSSIPTSSDSDTSHSSTPSDEKKPTIAPRGHGKVIKTLLQWVQRRTRKYGVAVQDFGKSWTSGLAFLAVIKSIDPSLVDMRRALLRTPRENIEEAFRTAHYSLGIPRLLEPEDVMLNPPDDQSIMTYVSQFLEHFPGIEEDDKSDILERNKASTHMNEPQFRNGVQRKRESYMVKRDSRESHPPPKIFVSSVSEDREQVTSPVLSQTPVDKPWSSEGSSVGSSPSPANDKPFYSPLDLNKDVSTTGSPQPLFSDSAVNSPDSWSEVLSETANSNRISEDPISESSTAGTVEVTSDLGSPFTPENHLDRELFIDEGNYSLGSMDSLHAKSTAASEEDDAYKCILDLKEEQSASHLPSDDMRNKSDAECLEQTESNLLEQQEHVKPSSNDPSCLESDSGFFQDNKEAMPAQPEDEIPLTSTIEEEVSGVPESESVQDNVESEAMQSEALKTTDGPEEKPVLFDYDSEPECPVLKYERVSISSEEDIKLSYDLAEDPTAELAKNDLLNGHSETHEDIDLHNGKQVDVLESEVKDVLFDVPEEPISEQSPTELEAPEEDQVCYMCGCPVSKSSTESGEEGGDCLSHSNSTERGCISGTRHFSESEAGGNFEDNPREQNNELNGAVSDLKNEPGESKGIHEDVLIIGKSDSESGSEGIRRTEFSHNTNGEFPAQVSDNTEPGGAKGNRPVSEVDSFVEPLSDTNIQDGEKISSPRKQHPEVFMNECLIEPETTCEDVETVIGMRGLPERHPAELRLSLAVTPLQPAPPKRSLTESDTDTEDASEEHGKGFKSRKARVETLHLQEQSPFDRHPGEWGAVEPDSPAEHCELMKTDEELTSAAARENTVALREEVVMNISQPLTTIHLRNITDITESKGQNGKASNSIKVDTTIINKSSESKPAASPESTYDTTLADLVYIILAAWLFVYCLLVLPQIDSRTLPKLLFNIDE